MIGGRDRLLVMFPHATRTGSTRVAADLLAAAASSLDMPIAVHLASGGPCAAELAALGSPLGHDEVPRAVIVNTSLAAGDLLAVDPGVPSVVYVHEPTEVVAALPAEAQRGLRRADVLLCVSEQVEQGLRKLGFEQRIVLLPPLVSARPTPDEAALTAARARLGASAGDRVVVACGEAGWRKGADLFVEVAAHMRTDSSLRFAWIGRRFRPLDRLLAIDAEAAGMTERIRWVGELDDPSPLLSAADVVLVCSRHDPQPLVPLEAALVGTPTAAFAVGGLAELAASGGALAAPFPDTGALAGCVRRLLDADLAAGVVARAQDRVAVRHSAAAVVPAFVSVVRTLAGVDGASVGKSGDDGTP